MKSINEINDIVKDPNLSVEERKAFVKTLTEDEMRSVFLKMCELWESSK